MGRGVLEAVKILLSSNLITMQLLVVLCHTIWARVVCVKTGVAKAPTPLGYRSCLTLLKHAPLPQVAIPDFGRSQAVWA